MLKKKKMAKETEAPHFCILIVDDNSKNLQVLATTLKQQDYEVEFAVDGKTALEWLNSNDFDLILLDIMMPGMNGFEVCKVIREDLRKDTPIIFLTAETEKEDLVKGFNLGAQDYITKPFNTEELLARVKTHLDLKYNKEQLLILNQSLEEKVNERTRELNLSNRKLIEANEKLLELDKNKAEFLKMISHTIRTPLNGILAPVQLIKDQVESNEANELIDILHESVLRLERFSSNALLITRLKTNPDKLYRQDTELNGLIQSSLDELKESINEKEIRVFQNLPGGENIISGELDLLKKCFVEILDNAVKYSEQGSRIEIIATDEDNQFTCEVKDYGKGFPQKSLDSLFELFSPGEEYVDQNLGLGLGMAKLIMNAHSGRIEVENQNGNGALVKLTFPGMMKK